MEVLAELERGADDLEGALDEDLLATGRFAEGLPEVRLRVGALDRLAMPREYP